MADCFPDSAVERTVTEHIVPRGQIAVVERRKGSREGVVCSQSRLKGEAEEAWKPPEARWIVERPVPGRIYWKGEGLLEEHYTEKPSAVRPGASSVTALHLAAAQEERIGLP